MKKHNYLLITLSLITFFALGLCANSQAQSTSRLAIDKPASGTGVVLNNETGGNMIFSISGSEKMRMDNLGRLGIGTIIPQDRFHVHTGNNGTIVFTSEALDQGTYERFSFYPYYASNGAYQGKGTVIFEAPKKGTEKANYHFTWRGGGNGLFIQGITENVGIGTVTPNSKLEVAGDLTLINQSGSATLRLKNNTASDVLQADYNSLIHTGSDLYIRSGNDLIINDSGGSNVGIGTATPDQRLSVNGGASKIGGGAWATLSDKQVKKNIRAFAPGLETILNIQPKIFEYNGTAGYPDNGKEYIGVIAQEIKRHAPYMVATLHKKLHSEDTNTSELLMYDGSALPYLLVNAVKELNKQLTNNNKNLKEENASLKTELNALKTRIETIEKLLKKD